MTINEEQETRNITRAGIQKNVGGFNIDDIVRDKLAEEERAKKELKEAERKRKIEEARKRKEGAKRKDGIINPATTPPDLPLTVSWYFDDFEFSKSSDTVITFPGGVDYIKNLDAGNPFVLQSLEEAIVSRIGFAGTDQQEISEGCQLTRTTAIYFVDDGGRVMIAFDDIADYDKNLVLALSKQGRDLHAQNPLKELILPKSDSRIREFLRRCIHRTSVHNGSLELSLDGAYQNNETIKHALGKGAELNAQYLKSKQRAKGYLWLLYKERVRKNIGTDQVLIRPCGLGGYDYADIHRVVARGSFEYFARARGIRSKNPWVMEA